MAFRFGLGLGVIPSSTRPVGTAIPANTSLPVISGIRTQGQTVTCSTGSWTQYPTSYAYQWQNAGSDIPGAASSTYVLQAGDVGDAITCEVDATNAFGTTQAESASITPAAVLTISGTPSASATNGVPYSFTPTINGGHGPYTVAHANPYPTGLSGDLVTGAITGTPTVDGVSSGLNMTVTDADGLTASLGAFSITVAPDYTPSLNFSDPRNSQYLNF